jgi:hypothetical protein
MFLAHESERRDEQEVSLGRGLNPDKHFLGGR